MLLGPRQTGKSTLVRSVLPAQSWTVDLLQYDVFLKRAKRLGWTNKPTASDRPRVLYFADTYAQTITYGLLTAAIAH